MKSRRGKPSEAFWPSLMMKKWLNIKPKEYDFSADEVDTETETETETESEDDGYSLKDARKHMRDDHGLRENYSDLRSQLSDLPSKGYQLKHRRGKSETVRAQYINTKDVRVTVGSWNVGGTLPYEDLDIDDWLCTEEPADVYILGFQEVVPLNAGNVLGAEDNKSIPKWEAIIRKTLNKSLEPESKHICYSAPPSPVQRTSSVADVLAETNALPLGFLGKEYVGATNSCDLQHGQLNKVLSIGRNLQWRRIYGIDCDSRLDWPELSLDATPQVVFTSSKLRRVLSSSARMSFNTSDNPLIFSPQISQKDGGLKRSHHSSGNLRRSISVEQQEMPQVFDTLSNVSDSFLEEEDDIFDELPNEQLKNEVIDDGAKLPSTYVRIVSKQMKEGADQRRNSDVYEIIRRTCFSSVFDTDQPLTIPSHDQIFWFGDLNYRLNMEDEDVRKLIALKRWDELISNDQLNKELRSGHVFEGWKEGVINFPPTYKYEINSDRYFGENVKEGEKKRSPAWCDRILWLGKGIRQLSYERAEIKLSDHRPVSSVFMVEVEVLDHWKLQRALNCTSVAVHPEIFLDEDEDLDY
ncbi:hypothetical protein Pyn_09702 [Prunus yedoensis var. nudiflora]|uniref:Inositol polyphosphate-related phosphatase domain-containing protein n=1 Tax=Prunus yedoensis var. nudiflora TaxID=2094558 RepID=A0A314UF40_PRUYE|nr:hypothetical protein Pyn_09702 [Prunus yedoensis var. nudiflora]